jgi:MFS family permease
VTTLPHDLQAVQRHTIRVLVVAQAFGALGMTIGFATAALLARDISGSDTQSGLVQTSQVLGAAVASYLLARLMSRRGRRTGLVTGYLIGGSGSLLAVAGGVAESMTLLLIGAAMLGATSAANNSSRYAATDLAAAGSRARALSTVVWASTIGAVAGPNLTGFATWTARKLSLPELTGPFAVGTVGILAAGIVLFVALRPDPLQVARQAAEVSVVTNTSWRKAFAVVGERPMLLAAMTVMAGAHAAMIMVMVMTPLHMAHGGADLEIIGVVISVHVLGMFAFAPVVGMVTDRVGRAPAAMAGATLLLVALTVAAASPEGTSWQVFVGLFLLGLGWSFSTVAGSTLITDHAPLETRADIQGLSDLVMGLAAAGASALSGIIVDAWGFPTLALVACVLPMAVGVAAYSAARQTAEVDA